MPHAAITLLDTADRQVAQADRGLDDAQVTLIDAAGNAVGTRTTSVDGSCSRTGLSGQQCVDIVLGHKEPVEAGPGDNDVSQPCSAKAISSGRLSPTRGLRCRVRQRLPTTVFVAPQCHCTSAPKRVPPGCCTPGFAEPRCSYESSPSVLGTMSGGLRAHSAHTVLPCRAWRVPQCSASWATSSRPRPLRRRYGPCAGVGWYCSRQRPRR